ncbi:hypothetical protein B0H13DRAFT_2303312 [Mycena leptocephala]|nr:hypothetical protein B0H13DRAFT_2303312 [Mycena leptocephala]
MFTDLKSDMKPDFPRIRNANGFSLPFLPQIMVLDSLPVAPKAAVCASAIVLLDGLTDQQRHDVLNSVLLAELAANHDYPKNSDENASGWYRRLAAVLANVGWIVEGFPFTDVKLEESGGSIVRSALDMLENDTNVTKAQFATYARAIFTLLQAGGASKAEKVFDDSSLSSSRKWVTFMICSASVVNGNVTLSIAAVVFSSSEEFQHALRYQWVNKTVSMKMALQTFTLNESVYRGTREIVKEKLEGRADYLVALCEDLPQPPFTLDADMPFENPTRHRATIHDRSVASLFSISSNCRIKRPVRSSRPHLSTYWHAFILSDQRWVEWCPPITSPDDILEQVFARFNVSISSPSSWCTSACAIGARSAANPRRLTLIGLLFACAISHFHYHKVCLLP